MPRSKVCNSAVPSGSTPAQPVIDDVLLGAKKLVPEYVDDDIFSQNIEDTGLSKVWLNRGDQLRKSFTGVDGAGTKAGHEKDVITSYDLFNVAQPMYNLEYLVRMYEDYTNYSAIHAKVANVVGLGYDFIESEKTTEKEERLSEGDDDEKLVLFRRKLMKAKRLMFDRLDDLNNEDEFIETIEKVVVDYEVTGNGYLEIGRSASGQIGYIGHIPSHTLRVRRQRDGFVQFVNGKPIFFKRYGDRRAYNPFNNDARPNEIIHFKKYNPADAYYGAPDIIPALSAVAGNKFADQYNLDYFENKAVPRNIILVRGGVFSDAAQRKLMKFFGEDLKGSHHRALYVPLPADTREQKFDFEVKSVETGNQDSAFREYTRGNIEKILMVHRVPATKLGMTQDAALAAAKDLDKTFKEQVCKPLQRVIEKKVNRVLAELTDVFKFKLNELDLLDEVSKANIDRVYHTIGATTANEIRAEQGKHGIDGGDMTIWEIQDEAATKAQASAQRSETSTVATGARARDTDRAIGRTDSVGGARNPKGEGRTHE